MARATSSRALPRRGILRRLSMAALTPNARAAAVAESATLAITARAAEMLAAGQDVVSLSAGEPDFPTPADVARAGVRAIESGDTRYTATSGLPELRRAAAEWLGRQFGLRYSPREVMVAAGAKAALHMALTAIVSPGDPVLLLAPYWVSYPDLVRIAGGEPVVLPPVPEQGFVHTRAQIEAAARRTGARGILLNYPNNPSGAVPTREQMAEIVAACAACDLWIVSDEIYATMTYDGRAHVSPATIEGARERTLFVGAPEHQRREPDLDGEPDPKTATVGVVSRFLSRPGPRRALQRSGHGHPLRSDRRRGARCRPGIGSDSADPLLSASRLAGRLFALLGRRLRPRHQPAGRDRRRGLYLHAVLVEVLGRI